MSCCFALRLLQLGCDWHAVTEKITVIHVCSVLQVDIYSFGVLLWELVTATPPIRGRLRPIKVRRCFQLSTMIPDHAQVKHAGSSTDDWHILFCACCFISSQSGQSEQVYVT